MIFPHILEEIGTEGDNSNSPLLSCWLGRGGEETLPFEDLIELHFQYGVSFTTKDQTSNVFVPSGDIVLMLEKIENYRFVCLRADRCYHISFSLNIGRNTTELNQNQRGNIL